MKQIPRIIAGVLAVSSVALAQQQAGLAPDASQADVDKALLAAPPGLRDQATVVKWKSDVYRGLLVDGALLTVNLPQSVVAVVAETEPSIKGAGNGTKDATLENGIKLKVGMMVNVGDKVRIDTETMEYKERVS